MHYSIAHEIAHTFFPDCGETVHFRLDRSKAPADEWQLEALCNVGAAEILMPQAKLGDLGTVDLGIERVLELREQYAVSTEAVLLRLVELARFEGGIFASSRAEEGRRAGQYRLDYLVPSAGWTGRASGVWLPRETVLRECTGIGFTATGTETWPRLEDAVHVEAVGIPPYPGTGYPRVVGLVLRPDEERAAISSIRYVRGNALAPRGHAPAVVAHIVNDRTPRWGGGFALAVKKTYPSVQEDFVRWAAEDPEALRLGAVRTSVARPGLGVVSLVAQKGYGPSPTRRVRYAALRTCLQALADVAEAQGAAIHMPRIGVGQGGGSWPVVEGLIMETLVVRGVPVTVYDLPDAEETEPPVQTDLHLLD